MIENIYFQYVKIFNIGPLLIVSMVSRGRPVGSSIRQNLVEILYYAKKGYGYQLFKWYRVLFPGSKTTMRSIYYNLHKGVDIGEFKLGPVERRSGNFSWGSESSNVVFVLDSKASPKGISKIKEYFDKG